MKGLKQLVQEALRPEPKPPVEVSNEARAALASKMREWSGWPNATVVFGDPREHGANSTIAACNHAERKFVANLDTTILNPNRVLLTVTPFRLKQEAVLTGALLHEAGHARHSHWKPRTDEAAAKWVHGAGSTHEGEPINRQTENLASLMEEPRIEGLMARNADRVGASGLGWTMRASSAALAPFTQLSTDPGQRVMDMITSWALRSGKQIAYAHWTPEYTLPVWVGDLTALLHGVLVEHLSGLDPVDDQPINPTRTAQKVIDQLVLMALCVEDRGTYMVDSARDICDMLFPETDGDSDDAPQAGDPHQEGVPEESESESESGDDGEGDEQGEGGEGNTEPEDEGEGDDPGAGDTGDDDTDEVSEESDTGKPGESDDKPDEDKPDEGESEDEPAQEGDEGGTQEGEQSDTDTESDLAKALRSLEEDSKDETTDEAEGEQEAEGHNGGSGQGAGENGEWRMPSKEEREVQHGAERFLRQMIEPTEASRVTLTDTPSSTIDGSAYEAWNAGGRIRAPHFFKQTRRTVEPSPPVRIGILVDVSMSMEALQEPSAMLSWALASAALDLRNFAGRGQQIESCLIHWGSDVRVVQAVGQPMPGIRTYDCNEWTTAWTEAMEMAEEQMPGFLDVPMTPVNRLVVNFTDWQFNHEAHGKAKRMMARMMESGVNMLSVVPSNYTDRRSNLPEFMRAATVQRSKTSLIKYNSMAPGQVWETAAEMLDPNVRVPAPFPGF